MNEWTVSEWLVAVQALAAAVSAGTAAYLVYVTQGRDREAREERERDVAREQLRRLAGALRSLHGVLDTNDPLEFDVARTEIAVALSLRYVRLQACEAQLDPGLERPPYAMGDTEPWTRLEEALLEVQNHALEQRSRP